MNALMDYGNAYQQQPQQPETAQIQPPGISIQPEPSQISAPVPAHVQEQGQIHAAGPRPEQVHHQQDANYPQNAGEQVQNSSYPVPHGLNPAAAAAVAALSQLTQFAGKMDAAERAMAGMQEHQSPNLVRSSLDSSLALDSSQEIEVTFLFLTTTSRVVRWGGEAVLKVGRSPYRGGGPGGRRGGGPGGPGGRRGGGPGGRRGGGRRGGGAPFRGGDRGNFGHRNSRPDGSGSPFRGRGRGKGGGNRRFPPRGAASTSSYPEPMPVEEPEALTEGAEASSAVIQGEAPQSSASAPAPEQAPAASEQTAPIQQPPRIAWCEMCRVDCTSLEILEQHKNGKRHKSNLQNANKPMSETWNEPKSIPESNPEVIVHPENVQEGEENVQGGEEHKLPTPENLPIEAVTEENTMESEQQNDLAESSEIAMMEPTEGPAWKRRMDRFDTRRRGIKRKIRGGRGGKRMRMSEGPRRPIEPPKPKEVIPLICDLCNVKCDTQAVFDCHLAGKKHLSKVKRFRDHQAMYGQVGLQVLYPPTPTPIAQSTFIIPQGHQQAVYGPQGSLPQLATYMHPQVQRTVATDSETQAQQTVTLEPEGQQQSLTVKLEAEQAMTVVTKCENDITEYEGKEVIPLDNSVLVPSENVITGAQQVLATAEALAVPEYGVTASDFVVLPGLDIKMEKPVSENEEPTEKEIAWPVLVVYGIMLLELLIARHIPNLPFFGDLGILPPKGEMVYTYSCNLSLGNFYVTGSGHWLLHFDCHRLHFSYSLTLVIFQFDGAAMPKGSAAGCGLVAWSSVVAEILALP
ncbi:hypothetical protein HHK36_000387 [Tetracentron sinense]|uniref:U1-type domain-containing protein n=1 Tax=Tetracentron sinense TaxID=13715 RepID=A0A835DPY5_TETSI|nr:hypothetical protein HHK36_000387 [Tetracentron sinense]